MNIKANKDRLDDIEKIDMIDNLLKNEVMFTNFINDIEAEEKRKAIIKRQIEIRNFYKLAVASIIAVVIWQTYLFDNSVMLNNKLNEGIEKIDNLKIENLKGGN